MAEQRLIDANELVTEIKKMSTSPRDRWDTAGVLNLVRRQPTVDAKPVVHGEWIVFNNGTLEYPEYDHMKCSVCGFFWSDPAYRKHFIHCPNCGADMRG